MAEKRLMNQNGKVSDGLCIFLLCTEATKVFFSVGVEQPHTHMRSAFYLILAGAARWICFSRLCSPGPQGCFKLQTICFYFYLIKDSLSFCIESVLHAAVFNVPLILDELMCRSSL